MRAWAEYRKVVLPLIEQYRDDEFPQSLKHTEKTLESMGESLESVPIHRVILDSLYEKPSVRELDRLRNSHHFEDDEFDQILDVLRQSGSFEEANRRALEIMETS